MNSLSRFRMSLSNRQALWGVFFTAPFLVGLVLFILAPVIQSIAFSISELEITREGFTLHYVGWENYRYALQVDANFLRVLTETTLRIITDIPAIIIFSFLMASILNQDFRGRLGARIIFFLPVILASGAIAEMEASDWMHELMDYEAMGEEEEIEQGFFSVAAMTGLVMRFHLPEEFVHFVVQAANRIPSIVQAAAIPILIFLAGLQGVSTTLYESARIEGATGWETFWKITFPLISPLIITNIVYIIIDSFTAPGNELVALIEDAAWGRTLYGVSVAMTWLYFGVVALFLMLVFLLVGRHVFYME